MMGSDREALFSLIKLEQAHLMKLEQTYFIGFSDYLQVKFAVQVWKIFVEYHF